MLCKHCKAANLNRQPVLETGVCSDSEWTAQRLLMAALQSLEIISGMILTWLQPKFGAKWRAIFAIESNVEACIDWMHFDFLFEAWEFLSNLQPRTIIFYFTEQSCIIGLNFKFSVLSFLRLWAARWALSKIVGRVWRENISTPIYVQCCNMYWLKIWGQEFNHFAWHWASQWTDKSTVDIIVLILFFSSNFVSGNLALKFF